MRLIVTGGAGFIGSAVVRRAVSEGIQVLNLDCLTYAANPENVASVAASPLYAFARIDVRDGPSVREAIETFAPDAVMHLAAESHVDRSIDGPAAFVDTNVRGTCALLEAVRAFWRTLSHDGRAAFRFHHVSTDEVYGSLGATGRFTELTPYAPNSPYAASKAASDHLARAWGVTYGIPVIVTNCSNNYGPYQFPEKLIPVVILNGLAGRPIPVYGGGENVRDWLYVEDHVAALLTALREGRPGETYNIGGDAECRNIDLVRMICAILDRERPETAARERLIAHVEDRPGHDRRYAINTSKIGRELGWKPSVSLEEGLSRTVRWYLDNEAWWRALARRPGMGQRLGLST